ncbi:MAG: fasciclin domain-containing protein [Prevotella sp.]|nr:fasciclin domain-containing protein [Prevotella sp.]
MISKYYKKGIAKVLTVIGAVQLSIFAPALLSSCSDEPDAGNYYTFTGQMMSEYLQKNENFSQFAAIVEKAGLMDQLSAYGHYTCFAPDNQAINKYLAERKLTIDQLTEADCDTIARTHLVGAIYSTSDMSLKDGGILNSQNMMKRNLSISHATDENGNTILTVNESPIYFIHQDDSVENGIVQPISAVIQNNTNSIANMIKKLSNASIFYDALVATGLELQLDTLVEDQSYNPEDYPEYVKYDTGAEGAEYAEPPSTKKYGFTAFIFDNETIGKYGVTPGPDAVKKLYDLACSIYDPMYPDDANADSHSFENITNPKNPLYRLMAYHLLDRNVQAYSDLTVREDLGVDANYANTTDWYTTMLEGTMIKVEHLIKTTWVGVGDILNDRYINRRFDNEKYLEHGAHVINPIELGEKNDALNGVYFYVSDILKFDETTRDVIDNCRIRMDFSTIFPELATNSMRLNGKWNDYSRTTIGQAASDIGHNYYFVNGYLKGVKVQGTDAKFVYRRPRLNFYSMHGDEFVANGVFDVEFELPPFPFEGDWQIRLGFAPMSTAPRGAVQIYIDGKAEGIPLNMDLLINTPEIYGSGGFPSYASIRDNDEKRTADFKNLKNKGYYRGPYSIFHADENDASKGEKFAQQPSTVRKVLCTLTIKKEDLGKKHTMRIKNVSTTNAKHKEAMLDYLEFVPKSVYGISGESGSSEDDL